MTFIFSTLYMFGSACSSNAESPPTPAVDTPVATPAPSGDSTSPAKEYWFAKPQERTLERRM